MSGWGEDYPSTVTALYFCGANFNAGDQSHSTPLHLAAAEGHVGTVRQLVEYGARLNLTNSWDQSTPLGVAEEVGSICLCSMVFAFWRIFQANQTEVVSVLRQLGATVPRISRLGPESGKCSDPPCDARCVDDTSNLALGGLHWGCYQDNFFMGPQPIDEPSPPKPNQDLGVIQGDTAT